MLWVNPTATGGTLTHVRGSEAEWIIGVKRNEERPRKAAPRSRSLELESCGNLHVPGRPHCGDSAEADLIRRRSQVGGRGVGQADHVERGVDGVELCVVQRIEGIQAELKAAALLDPEFLRERSVKRINRCAVEEVASGFQAPAAEAWGSGRIASSPTAIRAAIAFCVVP